MDALKAAPADKLRMEFTSGVAPCVIAAQRGFQFFTDDEGDPVDGGQQGAGLYLHLNGVEGDENFVYMVLPVRLKAN